MESKIGWLGGSSDEQEGIDETLVSADTYTGEVVRLTAEQLAIVKAHETEEAYSNDLMSWLGITSLEEADTFLADIERQA